jgi:hypothetical protein
MGSKRSVNHHPPPEQVKCRPKPIFSVQQRTIPLSSISRSLSTTDSLALLATSAYFAHFVEGSQNRFRRLAIEIVIMRSLLPKGRET